MDNKQNILKYEIRKQIYNLIYENPGLHLRELDRLTNHSFGALRYHLKHMQKRGLIRVCSDGGFNRYYVINNVGKRDKNLINAFRKKTLRRILIVFLLSESKRIFYKEDLVNIRKPELWKDIEKYQLRKHRTTVEFHLKKLIELDILESLKINKKNAYRIIASEDIWDFLVRYSDKLDYEEIKGTLDWMDVSVVPGQMGALEETVFNVFPHPYYC